MHPLQGSSKTERVVSARSLIPPRPTQPSSESDPFLWLYFLKTFRSSGSAIRRHNMDQTAQHLATLALLADLRRATRSGSRSGQNATNEPNSLLDMLLNPEFISPNSSASREVRRDDPVYDDLPPLEDESGPSSTPSPPVPSTEDDMPPLEDDEPPPLESDDAPPMYAVGVVPTIPPASSSGAARTNAVAPSTRTHTVPAATRTHHLPRRTTTAEEDDDPGADSDSMPSLQSVSDSSDDEDYMSESGSDWDDEEDLDDSDEENNLVTQMIEDAERAAALAAAAAPPRGPTTRTDTIDIESEPESDPARLTDRIQMYTELLERAVSVLRLVPPRVSL